MMLNHCAKMEFSSVQMPVFLLCVFLNMYNFLVNFYEDSFFTTQKSVSWFWGLTLFVVLACKVFSLKKNQITRYTLKVH